jgi:transposase-like protein
MSKKPNYLTPSDRITLESALPTSRVGSRYYKKMMFLLGSDKGEKVTDLSRTLDVSATNLRKWRRLYEQGGLSFLKEKARSGRPRVIDGLQRAAITSLACSDAPEGYARWSLRLLANKLVELEIVPSISAETVGVILKKTNCAHT